MSTKAKTKKKNKAGRPPKVDTVVVSKLIAGFNNGFNIEECCSYSGISKDTYYKWIKKNKRFAYDMDVAQQAIGKHSKKVITESILNGDVKAAQWWLERRQRKDFATRSEVTGEDGEKLEGIIIFKPEKYPHEPRMASTSGTSDRSTKKK